MNETTMSAPTTQSPPIQPADYNPRFWNGVIVLAFLLANVVGNGLVFCVYCYSVKRNVFSFYVIVLATLDLATAFTTMLFDVVIKMTILDPDSPMVVALCKFSHFQVYTNHMLCGFVLILIAHQRYTKVCYPHEAGMDIEKAVWILLVAGAICAFLSLSSLVTHTSQRIQLQVGNRLVSVTICRYAKQYDHSVLQALLSITLMLVFVFVLATTLTYYTYITRALKDIDSPFTERYGTGVDKPASPPLTQVVSFISQYYFSEVKGVSPETSGCISRTTYKVFAVVTTVFILSYVPHLTVVVLINFNGLDSQVMTSVRRFFLELAYNSPYISTVSNPIIYGFSRQEFRQQCIDLLTLKKYRARRSYF